MPTTPARFPQARRTLRSAVALLAAATIPVALASCSGSEEAAAPETQASASAAPSQSASPTSKPSGKASASATAKTDGAPEAKPADLPKLDKRNAIAFAPLSDPEDITVVGSVSNSSAWSTSKVLVVLAFIKEVAGGDPDNLSDDQKALIRRALTASDMDALLTLRGQIPGGSGAPMTEIVRSYGDNETAPWPDSSEGSHPWTIQNQIKLMAALANGEVVSEKTSKYMLETMHPIEEHSWGLGTIDAENFKGGWLTADTDTRQMGIKDGYAVAIITDGDGPAVLQTDGDSAHVQQMNKLAKILQQYLDAQ